MILKKKYRASHFETTLKKLLFMEYTIQKVSKYGFIHKEQNPVIILKLKK